MTQKLDLHKKIDSIEHELANLRSMVLSIQNKKESKKLLSLKGALKGISINEKDIESSKKSLFGA